MDKLGTIATTKQTGQPAKQLIQIGVIGAPNVGKSTLIAALARHEQMGATNPCFCDHDDDLTSAAKSSIVAVG